MELNDLNNLDYKEKQQLYSNLFSIGNFHKATSVNEKMILISLTSLVYLKTKEKNPKISPLDILLQIMNMKEDSSAFYGALENLSILVEDFCYDSKIADSCGLKTSKEIINKIKEILNSWIPF